GRANNACRTATAVTVGSTGRPRVLGVFMSDDYAITEWTVDAIRAELHLLNGGMSYLHILINDGKPDQAEIINQNQSFVAKPGEWVTEVLTVENDPQIAKPLKQKED